jgi:uncharacterized membrane protein YphA (DoxX/SURF4 family)
VLTAPLAHVKWFTDPSPYPTQYGLLLTPPVLIAFAVALVAVGVAWWVQRSVPEPFPLRSLERFAEATPLVLGLHVGVALAAAAVAGWLFVPSLRVARDEPGIALLVVEAVVGVLIALGLYTRLAAAVLALLGVIAMAPFSFESILEQVHILGIAAFFFLVGRGQISLDRSRGVRPRVAGGAVPSWALTLVRVAMGFGIAYTALTEKLLNPPLGMALLAARPEINILRAFGIGDPMLVYVAGVVELVIGIVIVSGQVTRPVIAVGAVTFTVTLAAFGWPELIGHLPFYGIMFTLFIAPDPWSRRVRRALQPAA